MAKSTKVTDIGIVATLVEALGAYLSLPVGAEPTIVDKVCLLHANDLYALLKPEVVN